MKAWLVVNGFVGSEKFRELYGYLSRSAEKRGITLEIKSHDTLALPLGEKICDSGRPDFVLFWDKDINLARRLESEPFTVQFLACYRDMRQQSVDRSDT